MKTFVPIAAALLIVLNAAVLTPQAAGYATELLVGALILALLILVASLAGSRRKAHATAPQPAAAEALKPAPAASRQDQARAEIITMLGIFQEKGRLVDFLMEDITPYTDEQVGSVVRSVHQGCKAALAEHFTLEPVAAQPEGSEITVPAGPAASDFRLMGNLAGSAPFSGKLVHKGWRVQAVKLPRVLNQEESRIPLLAPAQVEVG
jgi:hypothetical protein